ncbi:hypothetical protein H072_10951 [Dactylellina haptotyla CBS 200.50]|uniref:Uncharacterized protein n=1 Tax=Dactylellina haptotyla (strain CBS 200.50) TaxID=1284197 RepID=S8BK91_DACHA|nr:hypothetical protein H072_10951 [Dactylellina haptotyla CBS 200.50]
MDPKGQAPYKTCKLPPDAGVSQRSTYTGTQRKKDKKKFNKGSKCFVKDNKLAVLIDINTSVALALEIGDVLDFVKERYHQVLDRTDAWNCKNQNTPKSQTYYTLFLRERNEMYSNELRNPTLNPEFISVHFMDQVEMTRRTFAKFTQIPIPSLEALLIDLKFRFLRTRDLMEAIGTDGPFWRETCKEFEKYIPPLKG